MFLIATHYYKTVCVDLSRGVYQLGCWFLIAGTSVAWWLFALSHPSRHLPSDRCMSLPIFLDQDVTSERTPAEHYLLLGELRLLLNDGQPADDHQRWLLAVLDRLLTYWPHENLGEDTVLTDIRAWPSEPSQAFLSESTGWWRKLQRLRDRVAHRSPFQFLANEIRCDLQVLFDQRASITSA